MKVGDFVEITRPSAPQYGQIGKIIGLRVGTEWWVQLIDAPSNKLMSWRESSMRICTPPPVTEYELACRMLGEDYFA